MATSDPSYVRLATRLQRGMQADVESSGWSIAGLDVRKFPEGKAAARYVRRLLGAGVLEPASKAEWEVAHDSAVEDEVRRQNPDYAPGHQEAALRRVAAESVAKVEEELGVDQDALFEEFLEWRRAEKRERLQAQADDDVTNDDPEVSAARSGRESVAAKKSNKKKKAKVTEEATA